MVTKTLRGAALPLLALLLGACSQPLTAADKMVLLQTGVSVGAGAIAPNGSPANALGTGALSGMTSLLGGVMSNPLQNSPDQPAALTPEQELEQHQQSEEEY